jgi:hypothetical protein
MAPLDSRAEHLLEPTGKQNRSDIACYGFRQVLGMGDNHDLQGRIMSQHPAGEADGGHQRLAVSARQIDDQTIALLIGERLELTRQV